MLAQEWFSAAQLAAQALPGLPTTERGVQMTARIKNWTDPEQEGNWWRRRPGRGGGIEFHYAVLWPPAQAALMLRLKVAENTRPVGARDERWEWFERQTEKKQARARDRLMALDMAMTLRKHGVGNVHAFVQAAHTSGVALASLYNWERRVLGVDRADWLPFLADGWAGGMQRTECSDGAWEMLRSDFLRPERPSFEACWRRLEGAAKQRGWMLPSKRTLARRIAEIPHSVQVLAREGTEALKRMYPAQERTRAHFAAMEAVNADGHKWDVFVRWPDGEIVRPMMLAFQDLYSGKILSWRIDKSENKEATRLAFGDMVEQYGIPDRCWLDNGRQFASKWITGGIPNRFRFKVRGDEPLGLLTQLGVQVHWTTPYSGQSKPIERAFRDFAGDTARHPAFAGAWVGNNPLAKPENYGSDAVPLDLFLRTIGEAIIEHNARPGRRTAVCNGRSFDEAFSESYASALVRKASPTQQRLWLLMAESVRCASRDGSIELEGNRFWARFLSDHLGQRVHVRFDPQNLQDDLHVYALDGHYLGAAECIEAVGFDDVEAARAHAKARKAWMRAQRMQLDAERKLKPEQVAALLPQTQPETPPLAKVVRPVFGNLALKTRPAADDLPEQSDAEILLMRGLRAVQGSLKAD